jgi:hypothetical protein
MTEEEEEAAQIIGPNATLVLNSSKNQLTWENILLALVETKMWGRFKRITSFENIITL